MRPGIPAWLVIDSAERRPATEAAGNLPAGNLGLGSRQMAATVAGKPGPSAARNQPGWADAPTPIPPPTTRMTALAWEWGGSSIGDRGGD